MNYKVTITPTWHVWVRNGAEYNSRLIQECTKLVD
jgi:hypothetical protein